MSLGRWPVAGLCLALGACAASGAAKKTSPSEGVPPVESGTLTPDARPVVVLSGALAGVGAGARAPKPSSAWEMGHLLWGAWPAPTPGELTWAEAWGLSAETRFVYTVEAPAGPIALRQFARPDPCGAGVATSTAQHTLWLEPAPNAQRFVEALRWWLAGRGWSAVVDNPADAAPLRRLATLTQPATGARVWVDVHGHGIVLRWGSDDALGGRAPVQPPGLERRLHDPGIGGLAAQVDLPAVAALEAAMQAVGVARMCDALRDEAESVRDEVIAAQLDVASACVRQWTTLADLSSAVDARWSADGALSVEVALTPLGRRAWGSATRTVDALTLSGQTWARLAWNVERDAFTRAGDALSGLPSTWAELVETSGACALDPAAARAVTVLVAAPAVLSGAAGEVVGALGGVDGTEVWQLSFSAALGASANEDRVLAVVQSNRALVPRALWGATGSDSSGREGATREARVSVGDDTLAVRERVESDGVWTALASGEPLAADATERALSTQADLDPRAEFARWLEIALSPADLARAAQRRGLGLAHPELVRAATRAPTISVSAVRTDGRIVYRIETSGVGSARNER